MKKKIILKGFRLSEQECKLLKRLAASLDLTERQVISQALQHFAGLKQPQKIER